MKNPDSLSSALGGLPSTRSEIDETARMTILGSNGRTQERPASNSPTYGNGGEGRPKDLDGPNLFILNGEGTVRAATKDPTFRFVGNG